MGVLSAGASLLTVGGNIAGTVLGLGASALKLGTKIIGSHSGKLALGAGTIAVLCSDPRKGGFFGKAKEFAGNLFSSIKDMIGKFATDSVVNAAAVATNVGENVNDLAQSVAEADSAQGAVQAVNEFTNAHIPDEYEGMCQQVDMGPEPGLA